MDEEATKIENVRRCRARLGRAVQETPVHIWRGPEKDEAIGTGLDLLLKLELFQFTGSFKSRGALNVVQSLSPEALAKGITAVSAGNHAIAAAYAARARGAHAKVVMMRSASPFRVERARAYGAEVLFAETGKDAFDLVERLMEEEGRTFVHPFEGPLTAQGTGTLGLEFAEQAGPLDAVVVAIGGGGLCAGVAAVMKQVQPECRIYGVEPRGAATMHSSFAAGVPISMDRTETIADSLAPPMTLPYSFELCRRYVDDLVLVDDEEIRDAMRLLFREMKLVVEPAGAAATAALMGPLKGKLRGRVGVIVCGSNIDRESFSNLIGESTPCHILPQSA